MLSLGPIAFTAPWLLVAAIGLPALWLLLRVVPPAPIKRRFPGVALLLGLTDDENQSDKTPWWLLLLRTLAVALLIAAFAGPVLNPQTRASGSGPLLVLVDATWADAHDWQRRMDRVEGVLTEASRAGRPAALAAATDLPTGGPAFQGADAVASQIADLTPAPWQPDAGAVADWVGQADAGFDTVWVSDGLAREGRAATLAALEDRGTVRVIESPRQTMALRPPGQGDGGIALTALRARPGPDTQIQIVARGPDPAGVERVLGRTTARFTDGVQQAETQMTLPAELRNRVDRFEIAGQRSAGAVSLTDDALRRRQVALIAAGDNREGLELLSPLYYLDNALAPSADLIRDTAMAQVLQANPDVIILADVAQVADPQALRDWVEGGGLLVRFAGPRLAASDTAVGRDDPLMPVRLRAGGRSVGGAMSWGEPKQLRPFPEGSPFEGLDVPADVNVNAQVLAQPDPQLADRTIAALADGTPLVTRANVGDGRIVLFHVTASADWSSLPLSGLFVAMLDRLAISTRSTAADRGDLVGHTWQPASVLNGFGQAGDPTRLAGVSGERLADGAIGPDMPPGVYASDDRRVALNVTGPEAVLAPAAWPDRIEVEGVTMQDETQLTGALLTFALILLVFDSLASLAMSGKLSLRRAGPGLTAALALVAVMAGAPQARAQDDTALAMQATNEVVLAHVDTGNDRIDRIAAAGLDGLSETLFARTSVEPAEPMEVDLETDPLAVFPLLYWPITADQPIPSDEAYGKLNAYLNGGGMILFDTRDADIAGSGGTTPEAQKLQRLAQPLDIPPLEPVPEDHVLTRTFYLLQEFPGRYRGGQVWVEAAPPDAEQVEGMPFRDLNDGVTPVVIGGNDWAAAWARNDQGGYMFPVGSGYAGDRQRELAYRFGVNLVMHVLTGNYKSDQVHVPALLDRLGN